MDILLKRVAPPQEEPQAGPSGGVPEEGIAITDDSSMCVTALKTFEWDKMRWWKTVTLITLTLCGLRRMCVCLS